MGLYSPHQQIESKKGLIYLINPTVKEFKTTYFTDKNKSAEVILAPLETREFPHALGQTILNHLANFVLNESGFAYKTDINIELAEIKRKCIVYEQ